MTEVKSKVCVGRHGKPLRCYPNLSAAEQGSAFVLAKHQKHMAPYQCKDCDAWHLTPVERHTPSHYCYRCGKNAYETELGAERRARIIEQEQYVRLRVYECPVSYAWHLTSRR
jgi:hypothetical protein